MASPLTFYVQIKQDQTSQDTANAMVSGFSTGVANLLDETGIVHFAALALVPNPSTTPGGSSSGAMGLLLLTDFDSAMMPYLQVFFNKPGINAFLQEVASISYNTVPDLSTLTAFQNFIVAQNLTPAPPATDPTAQFYQAYKKTVAQINHTD